jgi:prepilin-type N-terminal cleavage/methylation domain-containing protein
MIILMPMSKKTVGLHGFTIVELLIVIVVIAVLATLPVAAYSGMQQRGRDTQRVSDMKAIVKGLEMYKTITGAYPTASTANVISGWEASSINPSQFLFVLKTSNVMSVVPVDPVNNSTTDTHGMLYRYFKYAAGSNGCDPIRGAYYVLVVGDAESSTGQLGASPGFQCSGRNWSTEGGWVTGGYTN